MKTTFESETSSSFKKTVQFGLPALTVLTPIALLFASLISQLSIPSLLLTLFNLGMYPLIWIAEAVATVLMPLPALLVIIVTTVVSIAATCMLAGLIGGMLIGVGLWAANSFYDLIKDLLSSLITNSKVLDMVSFAITAFLIVPGVLLSIGLLSAPLIGMVFYSLVLPILVTLVSALPALPMLLGIAGIALLGGASLLFGGSAGLLAVGYTKFAVDSLDTETNTSTPTPEAEIPEVSPGLKNLGAVIESATHSEEPKATLPLFADNAENREETNNSFPIEDAAYNI